MKREPITTWLVMIIVGIIFGLALVIGSGCAHWTGPVDPDPARECRGPSGYMLRAPNQINEALQDCYACELVSRCYDVGNHYCCEGPMCSECHVSPIFLGTKSSDGGER